MATPIAYDTLRLFLGRWVQTPRGIDRVDLGYARFFFESWRGDCVGSLPMPWGIRWYARDRMLQAIDRLEEFWSEWSSDREDPMLRGIKRALAGREGTEPLLYRARRRRHLEPLPRLLKVLSGSGQWRGAAALSVPQNAIYINVGQIGLAVPWFLPWLRYRPDVRSVFMLHDVIPLEHPEFVSRRGQRIHRKIVDIAAEHAAGLILTTAAARESVLGELRRRGRSEIPVETVPLPVAPVFLEKDAPDPELDRHCYFVVCGAIEPRKNHHLLLHVWRRLAAELGERTPKLVIIGPLGWGGQGILDAFQRSRALQHRVVIAQDLASPALRQLIANAKALLMPSFAEGFGLPVIEALTIGTPVVASDLPAHREIAGDFGLYRDPTDGPGWFATIRQLAEEDGMARALRRRIAGYKPFGWPEYFARVEGFLNSFG